MSFVRWSLCSSKIEAYVKYPSSQCVCVWIPIFAVKKRFLRLIYLFSSQKCHLIVIFAGGSVLHPDGTSVHTSTSMCTSKVCPFDAAASRTSPDVRDGAFESRADRHFIRELQLLLGISVNEVRTFLASPEAQAPTQKCTRVMWLTGISAMMGRACSPQGSVHERVMRWSRRRDPLRTHNRSHRLLIWRRLCSACRDSGMGLLHHESVAIAVASFFAAHTTRHIDTAPMSVREQLG